MTQKVKNSKTLIADPHSQTHTSIRVRQTRRDSHSIRLCTGYTKWCTFWMFSCGGGGGSGSGANADESARANTVVHNPAIHFGTIFSASLRSVDCVPRTTMMTLVYEITIDLCAHKYTSIVAVFRFFVETSCNSFTTDIRSAHPHI